MKHIIWILWPAFIAAGVAEVVFFTVIDPKQLFLLGQPIALDPLTTDSIGFFSFLGAVHWLKSDDLFHAAADDQEST